MPDVYAWPPLSITAQGIGIDRPGNTSFMLNRSPRYSQAFAARQEYSVTVSALGEDLAGAGYADMLKRMLDGKLALVRIQPLPQLYYSAAFGLERLRGGTPLEWLADGVDLDWDVIWSDYPAILATPGMSGGWDIIVCEGLPPNRVVAFPGELVRAWTGEIARVVTVSRADALGVATIRLDGPLPEGPVLIGYLDSLVLNIVSWPGTVMSTKASELEYRMIEVFADDFDAEFTEVDPWN